MMSGHFGLNSEIIGAIAKRPPHAKKRARHSNVIPFDRE